MTVQKLLLIDDDIEFIDLLDEFLTQEGFHITKASDGYDGLEKLKNNRIDLCVLDVMMPNLNGIETLKHIRQDYPTLPILMLTAKSEPIDRILGLELGADDYLAKPAEPRELSARVKAILRRTNNTAAQDSNPMLSPESKIYWDNQKRIFYVNSKKLDLTGIEYEILVVLAEKIGSIVSKENISLAAMQRELQPFDRSLDVHISNIRKKILDPDVKIKSVRGRGYQLIA